MLMTIMSGTIIRWKKQSRDYVSLNNNDNLDIDDLENSVLPWQTQQTCFEKRFMTSVLITSSVIVPIATWLSKKCTGKYYAYAAAF